MNIAELRFLAVEDHEFQRAVLLRILAGLGATKVSGAPDGGAALKIVKARNPAVDIIISDLDMPGMDGAQFMRHLGEAGVPVSVILASALQGLLLASVEATARTHGVRILGVIEKPVTPAKLEALIKLHNPALPNLNQPRTRTNTARPSVTLEGIVEGLKRKLDQWLPTLQLATPLDRSMLAAISGGNAAAEREILLDFRRVNDADAAMLKLAVDRRDIPHVTSTSNRIKDASRTVGAIALAAVCERLERASSARGASDWKAIEANMRAFQRELERLNFQIGTDCAVINQ